MIDLGAYAVISGIISSIVSAIALFFSIYTYLAMRKMRRAEYVFTTVKLLKEDARFILIGMRDRLTEWKFEREERAKHGLSLNPYLGTQTWKREHPRAWLAGNLHDACLFYRFADSELWNLILQDDFFVNDRKIEKTIQIIDKVIHELT